jgi:hypothetical protein
MVAFDASVGPTSLLLAQLDIGRDAKRRRCSVHNNQPFDAPCDAPCDVFTYVSAFCVRSMPCCGRSDVTGSLLSFHSYCRRIGHNDDVEDYRFLSLVSDCAWTICGSDIWSISSSPVDGKQSIARCGHERTHITINCVDGAFVPVRHSNSAGRLLDGRFHKRQSH